MRLARVSSTVGVVVAIAMAVLSVATRTTGVDATVAMTFGVQALLGPMFGSRRFSAKFMAGCFWGCWSPQEPHLWSHPRRF